MKRGDRKFADYLLFHKPNLPLAIIEAKDNHHSVGDGMCDVLEAQLTQAESASTQLLPASIAYIRCRNGVRGAIQRGQES